MSLPTLSVPRGNWELGGDNRGPTFMVEGLCGEIQGEIAVIKTMAPVMIAPKITSQPAKPLFANDLNPGNTVESMLLLISGFCMAQTYKRILGSRYA
jgi:hypothetical protein